MTPPQKRRKIDNEQTKRDLDVEIAIRQRLLQNIQSKITWASLLHESLEHPNLTSETSSLKDIATEAFLASDESTRRILAPPSVPPLVKPRARPTRENRVNRATPNHKFIYIRASNLYAEATDSAPDSDAIFLLVCPGCQRSNFTTLQGLYNHGRLTHQMPWGTHDECVKACATPADPELNLVEGHEVIPSSGSFRPDIKGLFARAFENQHAGESLPKTPNNNGLTETLGLHADTPALAPFLGRRLKPRQIRVFEQDTVDILSFQGSPSQMAKTRAAKINQPRVSRSNAKDWLSHVISVEHVSGIQETTQQDTSLMPMATSQDTIKDQTRFHLVSRITIADRSLWVKDGRYYKWMVSVDSPSYSRHITTILHHISITSSSPGFAFPPLTCSEPPFVVVGRTDRPFLARVELFFHGTSDKGGSDYQRRVFEHWVDLDPIRSAAVALGEEQILDVELDRQTALASAKLHHTPISSRSLWEIETVSTQDESAAAPTLYDTMLRKLLPQFPQTKKDIKGRGHRRNLPYTVMQTPEQLKASVIGRRKAIEWGRARALRDAYMQSVSHSPEGDFIPLSTADVYAWLEEHGHFIREPADAAASLKFKEAESKSQDQVWCCHCGFLLKLHPIVKHEETAPFDGLCTLINTQIMHLDAADLTVTHPSFPPASLSIASRPRDSRLIIDAADPTLTLAIRQTIRAWLLPKPASHSPYQEEREVFPVDSLGGTLDDVRSELSSYAYFGLLLRPLVRSLVTKAVGVASQDLATLPPELAKRKKLGPRLLTPNHILRVASSETSSIASLVRRVRPLEPQTLSTPRIKEEPHD